MISNRIYNHHSFSWNFVVFNIVIFLVIKFALSPATFKLATLLKATPVYSSREIIEATNIARFSKGLPALKVNYKLDLAAQEKLEDMANTEYFAHISPAGVTPWYWIKKAEYNYIVAGENLAIGFLKAQDTVNAWMDSSSHRANILGTGYNDIGVAMAVVEIDDRQGVLVVQMFGSSGNRQTASSPQAQNSQSNQPNVSFSPKLSPTGISAGAIEVEPPAPTEILIDKEPTVALNYISTDSNIPPATGITQLKVKEAEEFKALSKIASNFYFWYSLALLIASSMIWLMVGRTRQNALKLAIHGAIFVGVIFIPPLGPVITAVIF